MQKVRTSLLPFRSHSETFCIPEGLSIAEIVKRVYAHKVRGLDVIVNLGDTIVPKENWHRVYPKQGMEVGLNIVPAKGGGGKKNPLSAIISIALAVAAPYIAGPIAMSLAGGVYGAGVYTAMTAAQAAIYGAVRIGIGIVGQLATSMLSSSPKQSYSTGTQNIAESKTQFIEGASNQVNRYGVIPVNLGTNRMFPPQAALPYTETKGKDQYVRQLFTYGYGNVIISDRKIGETSISEFQDVEMEDRLTGNLDDGTTIYTSDVFQEGFSVEITNSGGYVVRTTQLNAQEAEIDISFNQGLANYNSSGGRGNATVEFEIVYAPTGTTNWSIGEAGVAVSSSTLAIPIATKVVNNNGDYFEGGSGVIALNLANGAKQVLLPTGSSNSGVVDLSTVVIPEGWIRIASYTGMEDTPGSVVITNEQGPNIPGYIQTAGNFNVTRSGGDFSIAAGTLVNNIVKVTDSTAEALRISKRIKFPSAGQYDIRIKRITADSATDTERSASTLSAIKSIRNVPPVNRPDISGTAIRIRGSDQLNGTVDLYNVIISTKLKDYNPVSELWVDGVVSSNPASIYRYVLQSSAFVKALPDNRLNLESLEEWWQVCHDNGWTYNRVIDYETSIDDLLNDIAAAGMATPEKVNGTYGVVIDNERPNVQGVITPRNSWGYSGNLSYIELPDALRVQFRNADKGYSLDERVVFRDGYSAEGEVPGTVAAVLYERLEFNSCTDADLAYFYGRRYIATAELQPETHSVNMDWENLSLKRGQRCVLVNDAILVGIDQGRIKSLVFDNPTTPTKILGFVVDETINVPPVSGFATRVRKPDASGFPYYALVNTPGSTNTFTLITPIAVSGSVASINAEWVSGLCTFTEDGKELDVVITDIRMNKDQSAKITCVNYAPERFTPLGAIPPFDSNITTPVDFLPPVAPELASPVLTDETVMTRNMDGSYTSRMVIPLINRNEATVITSVVIRPTGATQFLRPDALRLTPDSVILTGLQDGQAYDIEVRYQRAFGKQLPSAALQLNGVVFVGASTIPTQVQNFKVSVVESSGLFEWDKNPEIDIAYYTIRQSRLTSGALYQNSQVIAERVYENRITLPIQSGTYFIKAVDILGNESVDPAVIISIDNGAFNNVVELLQQDPLWAGVHDNTQEFNGKLVLVDPTLPGYYYFNPDPFDLSEVYENTLSASIAANLMYYTRIRTIAAIRALASVRGTGNVKIRTIAAIRTLTSMRGFEGIDWSVTLEMKTSQDNITYTAWQPFVAGKSIFRYVKFRLKLVTENSSTSPRVSAASVTIDMPDRYESAEDVVISNPATGAEILYEYTFKDNPAVNITLQNGAVDDRLDFTLKKDSEGFTLRVYNATLAGYVNRTFDWHAAGYGRVL